MSGYPQPVKVLARVEYSDESCIEFVCTEPGKAVVTITGETWETHEFPADRFQAMAATVTKFFEAALEVRAAGVPTGPDGRPL